MPDKCGNHENKSNITDDNKTYELVCVGIVLAFKEEIPNPFYNYAPCLLRVINMTAETEIKWIATKYY